MVGVKLETPFPVSADSISYSQVLTDVLCVYNVFQKILVMNYFNSLWEHLGNRMTMEILYLKCIKLLEGALHSLFKLLHFL